MSVVAYSVLISSLLWENRPSALVLQSALSLTALIASVKVGRPFYRLSLFTVLLHFSAASSSFPMGPRLG